VLWKKAGRTDEFKKKFLNRYRLVRSALARLGESFSFYRGHREIF
jgi:hypothetical protein